MPLVVLRFQGSRAKVRERTGDDGGVDHCRQQRLSNAERVMSGSKGALP